MAKRNKITPPVRNKNIDNFISEGGDVPKEKKPKAKKKEGIFRTEIRMPAELAKKVDDLREAHILKPSRNSWFLEAIIEKIKRDSQH